MQCHSRSTNQGKRKENLSGRRHKSFMLYPELLHSCGKFRKQRGTHTQSAFRRYLKMMVFLFLSQDSSLLSWSSAKDKCLINTFHCSNNYWSPVHRGPPVAHPYITQDEEWLTSAPLVKPASLNCQQMELLTWHACFLHTLKNLSCLMASLLTSVVVAAQHEYTWPLVTHGTVNVLSYSR